MLSFLTLPSGSFGVRILLTNHAAILHSFYLYYNGTTRRLWQRCKGYPFDLRRCYELKDGVGGLCIFCFQELLTSTWFVG